MKPLLCPNCRAPVRTEDRFCTTCGFALEEAGTDTADSAAEGPQWPEGLRAPHPEPGRAPRAIRFELGLALLERGRAAEAAEVFEAARQEAAGDGAPAEADLLLALAQAQSAAGLHAAAVQQMLQAALVVAPPRRVLALAWLLDAMDATAAAAEGQALVHRWWPAFQSLAADDRERLSGLWLVIRTHLLGGAIDDAARELEHALKLDEAATRAEIDRMLAAGTLPPPHDNLAGTALAAARLWSAAGDAGHALERLDDAIDSLSGPDYPEAPLLEAKADLLLDVGRTHEAAAASHEAGVRQIWRGQPAIAVPLLERAVALDPGLADAHWSLADALLMTTYDEPPDADLQARRLQQARAAWEAGFAVRRPEVGDAWAYVTSAYIALRSVELGLADAPAETRWRAAALIERSLLLTPDEPRRMANLCRVYRELACPAAARAAASRGCPEGSDDADALAELLIVQTNTGRWDEAGRTLERLEKENRTPWSAFVGARLAMYQGDVSQAAERIEEALRAEPRDLGFLYTKAKVLRMSGRAEDSRAIARAVMPRFDLGDRDHLSEFAWAALDTGRVDLALQAYEATVTRSSDPLARESALRSLGCARLAAGDLVRAGVDFSAGCRSPVDREARWLQEGELDDFDGLAPSWPQPEAALAALAGFRRQFAALPDLPLGTARTELEPALESAAPGSSQALGAQLALARLDFEEGAFRAAARRYAGLAAARADECPEAAASLERALQGWVAAMDPQEYWTLRDQAAELADWERRGLQGALDLICGTPAPVADGDGAPLVATPLALEMDESLLPPDPDGAWPLIDDELPAMRARILQELGVVLPGVRVRSDDQGGLAPDGFRVLMDDVEIARLRVEKGAVYAFGAGGAACPVAALATVPDALSGTMGCWVRPEDADELHAAGFEVVTDMHRYMTRVLEAQVRTRLDRLLGLDEVDALLDRWGERTPLQQQVGQIRQDDEAMLRLTRLLRRLLREQVPLTDGAALVELTLQTGLADADQALDEARRRLQAARGLRAGRQVRLDAALEEQLLQWLDQSDGERYLAIPGERLNDTVQALEALLPEAPVSCTLVVGSAELRPRLQELVSTSRPGVAVASAAELRAATAEGSRA